MASIKRDDTKQKWEGDTEFPLVCETCLGDNPYVRMTKEAFGKKCQICENPFTVFAWQAGTKGRLKRVEICRNCAQAKNVCQVCIYDLQYGLPVKVRDKILRESGGSAGLTAPPQSMANRAWFTAQQERALAQGQPNPNTPNTLAHAKLSDMARMEPRYERNMPKLCSFFAKGECDRGANCPFRHEMPRDRNDPMAKQNTKDRFYGTNDPVASKVISKQKRREFKERKQTEQEGYDKSRATVYLRFQGDGPYPNMTETDIRDLFYAHGEIVSVRIQADKGQAFVEYTQPEAAELAIAKMNRKDLLGRPMHVAWARALKRGDEETGAGGSSAGGPQQQGNNSGPKVIRPVAPPGGLVSKAALPKGVMPKPPPAVAAIAAARKQQQGGGVAAAASVSSVPRPSGASSVPRPGGGKVGGAGSRNAAPNSKKPYYPSANPERLGSKSAST